MKNQTEKILVLKPYLYTEEDWERYIPNEALLERRDRILSEKRKIDIERARITTQSYRENETDPLPIRRAKMLLALCEKMAISISREELIVGGRSLYPRMGVIAPEGAVHWVDKELDGLSTRPQDKFEIQAAEIKELREKIFPYWNGKTLEDTVNKKLPLRIKQALESKAFILNQRDHAQGHILPDVESWLELGITGIAAKIKRNAKSPQSEDELIFTESVSIALEAAQILISRYGHLAKELMSKETDKNRAKELNVIFEQCEHLVSFPARNFSEALQSLWFLFVLLQIESNASSFSPGRIDQYLLPYLKIDLDNQILNIEEAQLLLEHLWLKFNTVVLLRSSNSAKYFAGFPIGFNIVVGGQLEDGSDATNILSYMCLKAQVDVGLTQPNLSIRIHQNSPQEFLKKAIVVISKGSGMPQVFNDEVIIPGMIRRNVCKEDAFNYAVVGCVELSIPGKALGFSDASMVNMVRILELAIFGGKDPITQIQYGPITPALNECKNYEQFESSYDKQLQWFIKLMVDGCNIVDQIHSEMLPSPFLSSVIQNCINKQKDVTRGGAFYNFSGIQGVQVANVADILYVIKNGIFESERISAEELLFALQNNFSGFEILRQNLINKYPKYGNDNYDVDILAEKWGNRYCELIEQHKNIRSGIFQPGFYTVSAHVPMGADVGATPDGRFSGKPLADGGLSPSMGCDRNGPTAVLNSVSKINLEKATNGTLLNMKFLPSFFENDSGIAKFADFLRAFAMLKIPHVQFNVVSGETLRKAQKNPEKYNNLIVRVAGYSAYFVELDTILQDEIIHRTEFC
jgi:pyruvate formate-lyase/glycerol dehydratase family glycyl radical enzyme